MLQPIVKYTRYWNLPEARPHDTPLLAENADGTFTLPRYTASAQDLVFLQEAITQALAAQAAPADGKAVTA